MGKYDHYQLPSNQLSFDEVYTNAIKAINQLAGWSLDIQERNNPSINQLLLVLFGFRNFTAKDDFIEIDGLKNNWHLVQRPSGTYKVYCQRIKIALSSITGSEITKPYLIHQFLATLFGFQRPHHLQSLLYLRRYQVWVDDDYQPIPVHKREGTFIGVDLLNEVITPTLCHVLAKNSVYEHRLSWVSDLPGRTVTFQAGDLFYLTLLTDEVLPELTMEEENLADNDYIQLFYHPLKAMGIDTSAIDLSEEIEISSDQAKKWCQMDHTHFWLPILKYLSKFQGGLYRWLNIFQDYGFGEFIDVMPLHSNGASDIKVPTIVDYHDTSKRTRCSVRRLNHAKIHGIDIWSLIDAVWVINRHYRYGIQQPETIRLRDIIGLDRCILNGTKGELVLESDDGLKQRFKASTSD